MKFLRFQTFSVVSGLILSVAATASAIAGDAQAPRPSVYNPAMISSNVQWGGLYAGLSLGATGVLQEIDRGAGTDPLKSGSISAGIFGAHAGYNFTPNLDSNGSGWMFGAEADIGSLGGFATTKGDAILGDTKFSGKFLASARGRAGYVWKNLYLYATAGLAVTDAQSEQSGKDGSKIHAGVAYGVGAEWAVNDQWTARLEGISYNFADETVNFNGTDRNVSKYAAQVRAGLSFKF